MQSLKTCQWNFSWNRKKGVKSVWNHKRFQIAKQSKEGKNKARGIKLPPTSNHIAKLKSLNCMVLAIKTDTLTNGIELRAPK